MWGRLLICRPIVKSAFAISTQTFSAAGLYSPVSDTEVKPTNVGQIINLRADCQSAFSISTQTFSAAGFPNCTGCPSICSVSVSS